MSLNFNINSIQLSCQHFFGDSFEIDNSANTFTFFMYSNNSTDVKCPCCGHKAHIYGTYNTLLKNGPLYYGRYSYIQTHIHRYRCPHCGNTFTEEIPFKYPGTRITQRAAEWIKGLLSYNLSIKTVCEITGIHWDTVSKIHKNIMHSALCDRMADIKKSGYKPTYLAVDEFAIHKGHRYATTVMDLDTGEILWVGMGRSMAKFQKFFMDVDMDYLSEVKAVAMDMNASYNILFQKNLPHTEIVYDRFHLQSQYGKDVLGVVRLNEAKDHQKQAKVIEAQINETADFIARKDLKAKAKEEKRKYSSLKKSRWTLLMKNENLKPEKQEYLNEILSDHECLAICYAMKEEMSQLFEIRNKEEAKERWRKWFEAAKTSGIEPLVKFAKLKEKRINGLIAHAEYPIGTGKIEGNNNKIKVCKRIGYGYRNTDYFFTLIAYHALPKKYTSPNFP